MISLHFCDESSICSHLGLNTHVNLGALHLRSLVLIVATRLDLATVTFLANKVPPGKPEQGWRIDGGVLQPNS